MRACLFAILFFSLFDYSAAQAACVPPACACVDLTTTWDTTAAAKKAAPSTIITGCVDLTTDKSSATIFCAKGDDIYPAPATTSTAYTLTYPLADVDTPSANAPITAKCADDGSWYKDGTFTAPNKIDFTTKKLVCETKCTPATGADTCPTTPAGTTAQCHVTTTTTTAAMTTTSGAATGGSTGGSTGVSGGVTGESTTAGGGVSGGVTTGPPVGGVTTGSACTWSSWTIGDCNRTCGMCGYFSMSRTCTGPASCQSSCTGPSTMGSDSACPPTPCLFPNPNCCPPSVRMSENGRFVCKIAGTGGTGATPPPGGVTPTPPSCTQTWTAWSNAACNDSCGMCGQLLRSRTCSSSATCPCSGNANESVGPCPSNVCQFPREACCSGFTRQPVNGIYQCVSSGK